MSHDFCKFYCSAEARVACTNPGNPFPNGQACFQLVDYIEQDRIAQEGLTVTDEIVELFQELQPTWGDVWHSTPLKKQEQVLLMFVFDGLTPKQITEKLYLPRTYVYRILRETKAKLCTIKSPAKRERKKT